MGQIRIDLKIKLIKLGKTASDLSNELDVGRSTMNYWLNGYTKKGIPSRQFLRILAAFKRWEDNLQGAEVADAAN